jgi:hypothetical protein
MQYLSTRLYNNNQAYFKDTFCSGEVDKGYLPLLTHSILKMASGESHIHVPEASYSCTSGNATQIMIIAGNQLQSLLI